MRFNYVPLAIGILAVAAGATVTSLDAAEGQQKAAAKPAPASSTTITVYKTPT